ncbi:alpha-L-fucosidase [Olivibacter domesticus]|uniref:alpha-L-fucosidase n=1 Tax=Olivibacter domesticus TaxID=407022 RepID=A0A1H7HXF0_OLID1|nr:alpha-L-fucosidase [Olivibacter domesticus]SEK54794.1 alpha-L-fucosidase [Olivibacter domesticus]
MVKQLKCFVLFALLLNLHAAAQLSKQQEAKKMEWFKDAKLGIFVHWGIYSVNGISESWSFFNNYINHDLYMKQLDGFTANNYQANEWVDLITESGAKYAVITSKHHDGVALWDSKAQDALTTSRNSAAKKDVISPFVTALKAKDIKTGIYFSLPDWSYPNYDVFTRTRKRYTLKEHPERWKAYQHYFQQQLNELSQAFNPDLLWFDGDWEHTAEEWQADKILTNLRKYNPDIIVNARLTGHGDYDTPEQGVPVTKPANPYWELCYTTNDSWGYQPYDLNYKSANMIIRTLVDCISMGGNLLLDIGPKADGSIPQEQIAILKGLGRWTRKHQEAIYSTREGLPPGHFFGKTALSKDKKKVYLFLEQKDNNSLTINGLKNSINNIYIVGHPDKLTYKKDGEALTVEIPKQLEDQDVTVVCITLTDELSINSVASPRQLESLSLSDLGNDHPVERIIKSINDGYNPFINTNLTIDGLDYTLPNNKTVESWIKKHAEALYQTGKGIPDGHFSGSSALSADKQTLYLFVKGKPTGPIAIKGLKNNIQRARIVGEGTLITPEIYNKLYWSAVPGIVYLPLPSDRLDKDVTVIALLLDGPVDLYREEVGAIESNL